MAKRYAGTCQGNNDVLVQINKTVICGTDIHIYNWDEWAKKTMPAPMITGHEYTGEIVELGSNAQCANLNTFNKT
jgi:threonine 3-dehydrogenase